MRMGMGLGIGNRIGGSAGRWSSYWKSRNPYKERGIIRLVQIHCHTNNSDGGYTPAQVGAFYLAAGYDALAITDHDLVTVQPAGLIAITGNELSPLTGHVGSLGSDYTRGVETDTQAIINGIIGDGGVAILNHPNWTNADQTIGGHTYAEMLALTGYHGIEIHNAVTVVQDNFKGYAVTQWDLLLSNKSTRIWGFASDDFHTISDVRNFNVGRIFVFSKETTEASIITAIKAGNFVADVSNYGVTLNQPVISGKNISLTCPGATNIKFYGATGLLQSTDGITGTYAVNKTEKYVRIEAIGNYIESFGSDVDWNILDVNAGTWAVAGGTLNQSYNADPTVKWVSIKRHIIGDLEITCDVLYGLSGYNDGQVGIVFNSYAPATGYYLRIKGLEAEKDITLYKLPSTELGYVTQNIRWGTWYSLRIRFTQATGNIKARVWTRGESEPSTWSIDVNNTDLTSGGFVALRCIRDAKFDNLVINGFKSYYQPITVD